MKNDFQPSLIGLFIVTVLLFGVMTTARRPGYPCQHIYRPKNGKCSSTIICQAECTKERNGIGRCFPKHVILCACMHRQR
ncbi:unnamed protein product [Brassica oleracea]|uniref:Knottin scorpion toxin-like domain-containing protein n=1 Tax=Brassica oleracea TaxID=3712 RepID=A0A3P6CPW6_BRAOL|nr:unnamed protein product [Brassica oleracea]